MVALTIQFSANNMELSRIDESTVCSDGNANRAEYYKDRLKNLPNSESEQLLGNVTRLIDSDDCKKIEVLSPHLKEI